jgi:hypothetical protein
MMNASKSAYLFLRSCLGIISIFTITACTVSEATIQLGGSLNVFPTDKLFDITNAPDDWVVSNNIIEGAVFSTSTLGSSTFSITSSTNPFHFARRVKASLLATPYLSWQWKLQPGNWKYHPVQIIVGFSGGGTLPSQPSLFNKFFPGPDLPHHDRVLSFLWAPSALMRGNLKPISNSRKSPAREAHYVVRGGTENVGFWWHDTVDLASLYKLSWPTDAHSLVQVRFIGVDSLISQPKIKTYISDLRLSR